MHKFKKKKTTTSAKITINFFRLQLFAVKIGKNCKKNMHSFEKKKMRKPLSLSPKILLNQMVTLESIGIVDTETGHV